MITITDINGTPHRIVEGAEETIEFLILSKCYGSDKYLVLASSEGGLFNPLDINHVIHKRDRERGGLFWRLRSCSFECYRQYNIFLKTKNKTPHLLAERRFCNDF